ncbi:MAG: hypothetical protein LYZ66_02120 [Nitrososphaerales archaeon]|nr:hypothetical protein [Nitrososphaerales archaeon]
MVSTVGRSGVTHEFSEVQLLGLPDGASNPEHQVIERVADTYDREVGEVDVVAFYAKVLDVSPKSASVAAPSFTDEAAKLALGYHITLERRDREPSVELLAMSE